MKLDQKAKNYAEALYNVSAKSESEITVMESLVSICNAIRSNAEFRSFLLSKRITSEQKASATKEAFQESCHPVLSEFMALFEKINFVKILPLIAKYFAQMLANKKNIVNVSADVTSEISDTRKSELKTLLDQSLGKNSEITFNIVPELIGGIRLRVDNQLVDASILNHLKNMRQELLDA